VHRFEQVRDRVFHDQSIVQSRSRYTRHGSRPVSAWLGDCYDCDIRYLQHNRPDHVGSDFKRFFSFYL